MKPLIPLRIILLIGFAALANQTAVPIAANGYCQAVSQQYEHPANELVAKGLFTIVPLHGGGTVREFCRQHGGVIISKG